MERKIKKLENFMTVIGVTQDEAISYWRQKAQSNSKKLQVKELPVVNPDFPASDIRSRTKLYWYAFEGGKFSPDSKAYPNCQGVVGWINPDLNASEGDKIYVVLPEQQELQYSDKDYATGATDLYDGRANTQKLIEYGRAHNVKFFAAEYAYNYCKNGVKQGEAFLPAREQLERVVESCYDIRKSLKLIGGTFEDWLWSSSEDSAGYAWYVFSYDCYMNNLNKNSTKSVSCFLSY